MKLTILIKCLVLVLQGLVVPEVLSDPLNLACLHHSRLDVSFLLLVDLVASNTKKVVNRKSMLTSSGSSEDQCSPQYNAVLVTFALNNLLLSQEMIKRLNLDR